MKMQFLCLYFHIPFCQERCTYCAFNIYTGLNHLIQPYVDALHQEIRWQARSEPVPAIYFGGGTPSLLTSTQVKSILTTIQDNFEILPNCEITLEANPDTLTQQKLDEWRELGVNRLSLGMQSIHNTELTLFGRDHTQRETDHAIRMARQAGFDNLSLDLIYGVPHQTLERWCDTLAYAIGLTPEHFSLYSLQIESGTELARRIKYGELPMPDDDIAADMYDAATDMLAKAGIEQYEISSWGKPSRHNLQYWYNLPYLGLGAGAHGYANGVRTVNVMRPEKYIERITSQSTPLIYPRTAANQSAENIGREEEMFETVILRLRLLKEGLPRGYFEQRFGEPLDSRYGNVIQKLKQQRLIEERDDTLFLAPHARLIGNRVFQAFLPETQ